MSKPEAAISSLNYLAQEEINKLLVAFYDTKVECPRYKTIVDIFEEQVKIVPEIEALKDEFKSYTYFELNKL